MKLFILIWSSFFCIGCQSYVYHVNQASVSYQKVDTSEQVSAQLNKKISFYRSTIEKSMSEVLCLSDTSMIKSRPESLLGNFFADACFSYAQDKLGTTKKIDFALFNYGGLRSSLPKGEITRGNIYELMPFDNELVTVELTGNQVLKALNYIKEKGGEPVSHLSLKIINDSIREVFIQGIAFDSLKSYTVLTSDYLAQGGDKMAFFQDPKNSYPLQIKIRDALIEFLNDQSRKSKSVSSRLDGRVKIN